MPVEFPERRIPLAYTAADRPRTSGHRPAGHRALAGALKRLDHLAPRIAPARAQVVGVNALLRRQQRLQRGNVAPSEIYNVYVIAYAGAIDCGVIVPKNIQLGQFANGDLSYKGQQDRKSTRLNSSHVAISYA